MTQRKGHGADWLLLFVSVIAVSVLVAWLTMPAAPVQGAPLAQATETPTPTLPALRVYSEDWGVQSLPRAGVNCVVDLSRLGGQFNCVAGTPVP